MSGNSSAAFDNLAESYDHTFSGNRLGGYYRDRVWQILSRLWPGDNSLLELNAGTGEDAIFLATKGNRVLATDRSREMLAQIRHKLRKLDTPTALHTRQLDLERLDSLHDQVFDGALSNFGGLNCIADINGFATRLSPLVRPGGTVVLCLMGRWVPWEWCWYLLRGEARKSVRRLRGRARWRGMNIYYPAATAVIDAMRQQGFICRERHALGLLMPPTYANGLVEFFPAAFRVTGAIEQGIARWPLLYRLSDHYVLVFTKH